MNNQLSSIFLPVNNMQNNTMQTNMVIDSTQESKDPLDDLSNAFSKMNIAGGYFSEVFLHFFKTQPNTMINFNPTQHIKWLEGITKFNSKYEQDFIKQIQMYNALPYSKHIIEYKKENNPNMFDFYNCTYRVRFTSKK